MWLANGSTSKKLIILMGREDAIAEGVHPSVLRVTECGKSRGGVPTETMWEIFPVLYPLSPLRRIEYGVTPTGYQATNAPSPLVPGCYVVQVSTVSIQIRVAEDGRVFDEGRQTWPAQKK